MGILLKNLYILLTAQDHFYLYLLFIYSLLTLPFPDGIMTKFLQSSRPPIQIGQSLQRFLPNFLNLLRTSQRTLHTKRKRIIIRLGLIFPLSVGTTLESILMLTIFEYGYNIRNMIISRRWQLSYFKPGTLIRGDLHFQRTDHESWFTWVLFLKWAGWYLWVFLTWHIVYCTIYLFIIIRAPSQ